MDIAELQKQVQDAIDGGATTVEQVHRQIANAPLEFLTQAGLPANSLQGLKDFQDRSITGIYDLIRGINKTVGEIAREQLSKMAGGSTGGAKTGK